MATPEEAGAAAYREHIAYDTKRREIRAFAVELGQKGATPGDWACLADMARELAEFPVGYLVQEHWRTIAKRADARSVPPANQN